MFHSIKWMYKLEKDTGLMFRLDFGRQKDMLKGVQM